MDSWETQALRNHTGKLEKALVSDLRFVANELNAAYILTNDELEEIKAVPSWLSDSDKAGKILSTVKRMVKLNSKNFEKFVNILKMRPKIFETILDLLSSPDQDEVDGGEANHVPASSSRPMNVPSTSPFQGHPIITKDEEKKMIEESKPHTSSQENRSALKQFCQDVELIIQTANENEYYVGTTFMKAPEVLATNGYTNGFIYPHSGTVVGMFAGKKIALIRTGQGRECETDIDKAIENFPNVQYILGVGVCYGSKEDYKLGDVLVSNRIQELVNPKFENGEIQDRYPHVRPMESHLRHIFCEDLRSNPEFEVSAGRQSVVHVGTILSYSALINWKELREKLRDISKYFIGGEMEGGELLRFTRNGKIKDVIIIKGVADYGDGEKKKNWQFTAASAAFNYTEYKYQQVLPKRKSPTFGKVLEYCLLAVILFLALAITFWIQE